MAKITGVKLDPQTWTEVTSQTCEFQNRSHRDIYVQFSDEEPTNLKDCYTAEPLKFMSYNNDSDKLWAYNPHDTYCVIAYH